MDLYALPSIKAGFEDKYSKKSYLDVEEFKKVNFDLQEL